MKYRTWACLGKCATSRAQYCTGEATGFLARQKLHQKYNAKTIARAIRLMTDVTRPEQVKEIRLVEAAITARETMVQKLESEFGESLASAMKIAAIVVPVRQKSVVPARRGGLLDAPSVDPIAVVLSIAREDLVNAESHWTVNCTEPCQTVVGVGRRRRLDAWRQTHWGVVGVQLRSGGGDGAGLLGIQRADWP